MTDELTYIAEGLRSLVVPIDDLHVDPANARTAHALDRIATSLKLYGQRKPIIANRLQGGKIEAGNGTWLAAKERLGWSHIAVVFVDDDPATAAAYGIADNRLSELSEWDLDALGALLPTVDDLFTGFTEAEIRDLLGEFSEWDEDMLRDLLTTTGDLFTGFDAADLDDLVGVSTATATQLHDPGPEIDRAQELLIKWQVQPGQIWRLGKHRLMCGDSTERSDVERLMAGDLARLIWSDPPYNVDYGGSDHPVYSQRGMNNDNLGEKFFIFVNLFVTMMRSFCEPGAPVYVAMGTQEWPVIDDALRKIGFYWSSTIIWVKDQFVLSRKDYHTQYEPLWYGWDNRGPRLVELEDRTQSDVWMIDRPKKSEEHPTMKPVRLVERSILNSSQPGDIVLDLFAGSGTTLITCELTGRVCCTMDNDPKYAAVVLERWSQMVGEVPTLEET
jgi:DNA modification methylase